MIPSLANHPARKLLPSAVSQQRLAQRAYRLYERKASPERLWQFVNRWHRRLHGGLDGMVFAKGGITKCWVYVLKHLHISGATVQT